MALTDSLTCFWELEEASGTRNDATATAMNLTDNNTVTSTAGKVATGAQFTAANVEYLSHIDDPALRTGNIDFSLNGWINVTSFPTGHMPVIFKTNTGTFYDYLAYTDLTTHKFVFQLANGATTAVVAITSTTVITTGSWFFWSFKFNAASGVGSLKINNGTADTAAKTGTPGSAAGGLRIGGREDAINANESFNGLQDQIGLWKRCLSDTEESFLYNGGDGRSYAAILSEFGVTQNYQRFPKFFLQQPLAVGRLR